MNVLNVERDHMQAIMSIAKHLIPKAMNEVHDYGARQGGGREVLEKYFWVVRQFDIDPQGYGIEHGSINGAIGGDVFVASCAFEPAYSSHFQDIASTIEMLENRYKIVLIFNHSAHDLLNGLSLTPIDIIEDIITGCDHRTHRLYYWGAW